MAETLLSPGVLTRENDFSFIQPVPVQAGAAFIGPTVKGPVEYPTLVSSYSDYINKFGVTFTSGSSTQEFLTSLAVRAYFQQGGTSAIVTRVVSGSFTSAESTAVSSSYSGYTGSAPFVLETLGKGAIYNNALSAGDAGTENADGSLVSGSVDNLRWEVTNVNNAKGTFSLLIRRGDDNRKSRIVLETFNNLSLDPLSDNYIETVIGNQASVKASDGTDTYITITGDEANRSRYVRVKSVSRPTLNYLGTDGVTVRNDSNGISYSGSLPSVSSGSFYGATGLPYRTGVKGNYFTAINNTDTQGLQAANYADAISILSNKDEYVFNIISTPGLIYDFATHAVQLDNLVSMVETRGDCIAVVDVEEYGATVSNVVAAAEGINSSYAATYWPWVQVSSAAGGNKFVPASVVIPGVYAFTDRSSAPWFAPAGLVRGGIPGVIQAERKLTSNQRDALYDGNVNPIATFPGQGISVFGQKTLQKKASALDRVNVRRLLITLKKFIGDQARNLIFQQNTSATREAFLAVVNPYLDSVVQRQGLFAYRVVMDESNNTPDVVDRNELVGQIFLQPSRTAEFIKLDFTIEPTGATFTA